MEHPRSKCFSKFMKFLPNTFRRYSQATEFNRQTSITIEKITLHFSYTFIIIDVAQQDALHFDPRNLLLKFVTPL